MTEVDLQLPMPNGIADAVLFSPESSTPLPGVLHYPDIASIREAQREMARHLAAQGYIVLMPNPFYRTGPPPVWAFPRKMGEPRTVQRMAELTEPLTANARNRDAAAYVEHLLSQPNVRPGSIGVVGYCIGGSLALQTAAASPQKIAAAASFHGGNLYKADAPDSPHRRLSEVKARLYFGHAVEDKNMTSDDIAHLEQALAAWGGTYESETYDGAAHGWTVPDNPAFNPPQAERAFRKLTQLFAETLR
ncbi:MAG TPA: dienelactone hydrolase family protein [Acidobacteriaceae bacterium]